MLTLAVSSVDLLGPAEGEGLHPGARQQWEGVADVFRPPEPQAHVKEGDGLGSLLEKQACVTVANLPYF